MSVSLARAIVFDLDGTLVDSLDDIAFHLNAALADHGLPARTRAEISEWVGYGSARLVERAVPDPGQLASVLAAYRAHYHARPVIHTRPYPGIGEALDALAPGRTLAVLSNKPHAEVVAIVQSLLARWSFAAIAGERPDIPRKPDPHSVLSVLDALGIAPRDATLVGDSEVDIATARAAGLRSIAVTWGFRDETSLRAAGPDVVVRSPAELAALAQ
jgi:phosphoglycolate phosphatase